MSFCVNSCTDVNMHVCMYEHKLIHLWLVCIYFCMYVYMYVCLFTELFYPSTIAQELLTPMRSYELMQNMIDEDLSLLWTSGTYIHTHIHIPPKYIHTYSTYIPPKYIHTYIQVHTGA
jgi:hypothetical protein